jgi:hypothetical protein
MITALGFTDFSLILDVLLDSSGIICVDGFVSLTSADSNTVKSIDAGLSVKLHEYIIEVLHDNNFYL